MDENSPLRPLDGLLDELYRNRESFSYQVFEAFILRLVRAEIEGQDKHAEFPSGKLGASSRYEFDLLLPQGIADIEGVTAVEIKLGPRHRSSLNYLGDALTRLSLSAARYGAENGLLIHTGRLSSRLSEDLSHFLEQLPPSPRLFVWGLDQLEQLVERHPESIRDAETSLALLPLKEEFRSPEPDWRDRTRTQLQQLKETYKAEGVTLVLGAGVSASAGLPAWDSLIASMYVTLLAKELGASDASDSNLRSLAMAAAGFTDGSPLLSARYIRRGLEDGTFGATGTFQDELTRALYTGLSADKPPSSLIQVIARLCQPARTGPRVRSVITYNFDDLVESELARTGVQHRAVYTSGDHLHPDELPVHHVHGFLPQDSTRYENLEKSLLAFSEEGYHELFRNPYHWTNIVQLNAFRESTCVLIGLSLTDPNLRRLLEFATDGQDKPRHVALMRRRTFAELEEHAKTLRPPRTVDPDLGGAFLRVHHSLEERVLRELGVETVWFESFADLPELLASIN
jgi:SIR2-like domain